MDEEIILISAEESGERIDALLALHSELSRNAAQRLIEQGYVLLNGQPARKNTRCKENDLLEVTLPETEDTTLTAQNIPLEILFEDNDVIVINKPRGMVVHPAPGHPDGTVVNALLYHCGDSLSGIGGEKRPGIVHRIDKDTSGLLIAAKNDEAHRSLSAQLADRSLSREYEAVVCGGFRADSGTINRPIGRNPADRKKMAVTEKNSRQAETDWEVICRYREYTHVKCRLKTGHMASIGHPLLGDGLYGARSPDKGLEGQCLHARKIRFLHPSTGEKILLETQLPDYFQDVLSHLGKPI